MVSSQLQCNDGAAKYLFNSLQLALITNLRFWAYLTKVNIQCSSQNQLEEKKVKITQFIDNGNQLLNLDLVPRDEHGNKVNPVTCSDRTPDQKGVLELYSIVSVIGSVIGSTNSDFSAFTSTDHCIVYMVNNGWICPYMGMNWRTENLIALLLARFWI